MPCEAGGTAWSTNRNAARHSNPVGGTFLGPITQVSGYPTNQDLTHSSELESGMTIRMRRWILVGVSVILFFLAFATVWYQLTFYDRAYAWLTPGATKAEVLKHFGQPQHVEACRPSASWEGDSAENPSVPCAEEFSYTSHVSIGEWIIRFDRNGRVISKGFSQSP
jgi:hypothetical protein